ncbi:MAG: hypothetical protein JO107_12140 [Hyphomicrobiales bacterium]|nr:hypothetical protein [Hyphomicrobiales bacterium]
MAATQIGVFNKALRHLEERKLLTLNENRESLRYLSDEWSDAIEYCLYQGFWNFGMREQELTPDANQAPNFGFQYCFTKPADWVRTFQLSDNENYNPLLRRYADQNNIWYADVYPIYVRFISNDPNFGLNMALWTPGFVEYLAARLARLCGPRLKQAQDKVEALERIEEKALKVARGTDAMDLPPGETPVGTWVQARAPRGSILPMGNPVGGALDD